MATNKGTQDVLKRMATLIDMISHESDTVKELKTWNKMFKKHIGQQKSQGGSYPDDTYTCDIENNKVKRHRYGKIIREY